jgi:hypothetical protein
MLFTTTPTLETHLNVNYRQGVNGFQLKTQQMVDKEQNVCMRDSLKQKQKHEIRAPITSTPMYSPFIGGPNMLLQWKTGEKIHFSVEKRHDSQTWTDCIKISTWHGQLANNNKTNKFGVLTKALPKALPGFTPFGGQQHPHAIATTLRWWSKPP